MLKTSLNYWNNISGALTQQSSESERILRRHKHQTLHFYIPQHHNICHLSSFYPLYDEMCSAKHQSVDVVVGGFLNPDVSTKLSLSSIGLISERKHWSATIKWKENCECRENKQGGWRHRDHKSCCYQNKRKLPSHLDSAPQTCGGPDL